MSVVVVGAGGMLGSECASRLMLAHSVYPFLRSDIDITQTESLARLDAIDDLRVIVNCSGYTQVDRAESEPHVADAINHVGVGNLARYCKGRAIRLIHFSTDYVFSGELNRAYCETDPVSPLGCYAESKLAGERAIVSSGVSHIIFRIQWVYGTNGTHFIRTIHRVLSEKDNAMVVVDQLGAPTWTRDIADSVSTAISRHIDDGIYHLAPPGVASWFDVAHTVKDLCRLPGDVFPVTSDTVIRPARRPLNSRLNCQKAHAAGVGITGYWRDRLRDFLTES